MEQIRRSSARLRVGLTLLFLAGTLTMGFAQIQYSIKLQPNGKTYLVSLKSATTQTGANQYTSSAQVTVVVPAGVFTVSNLQSIAAGTSWSNNTTVRAPSQSPGFDYFIFGLAPNAPQIPFTAGQETPLFSFDNLGACPGKIELWAANDPFQPNPPTQPINVGNELTAFGFGYDNAWTGNYNLGLADCSAGVAPTVAITSPRNVTTTTTPTISGTATPGSTVVLTGPVGTTLCTTTATGLGNYSCVVSLSPGVQSVTAVATSAGGVSTPDVVSFTAVSPPSLSVTSPVNTTTTTTPTISGTATPGSAIVITGPGPVTLCTTTASASGSFACALTSPLLVVPTNLTVSASGPGGTTSQPISFTTVGPPSVAITSPINVTTTLSPTISGTATPGSTVVLTGPVGTTLCTTTANSSGLFACGVSVSPGPNSITAVATTPFGVSTPSVVSFTAVSPPSLSVTSPINTTTTTTPTIAGTATPGSAIVITGPGPATLCTTTASASGSFACALTSPLPVGPNSLTVSASGPGGTTNQPISFTTVAPPTVAIVSPANGGTATTTPTISGTATPGSTVVLTGPAGTTLCTTTANASGLFACGVSVSPGPNSVTAVATNPAGVSTPNVVSFTAVAPAVSAPDLVVSIGQPSPNLVVGQTSSLPVSVSNIGALATTGPITVTLSIPASLTAPASFSSNGFGCTTAGTSISCSFAGPISNGASALFTVPITPLAAAAGTTPTISGIIATANESNTANNTTTTTVNTPVDGGCQAKAPALRKV